MTFLFFLILVVGAVLAYRYRVPLIAKITGQQESRIRQRAGAAQAQLKLVAVSRGELCPRCRGNRRARSDRDRLQGRLSCARQPLVLPAGPRRSAG